MYLVHSTTVHVRPTLLFRREPIEDLGGRRRHRTTTTTTTTTETPLISGGGEYGNKLVYLGYRREDNGCPQGQVLDVYGYCR